MARRRPVEAIALRPSTWSTRTLAALWGVTERRINEELARRPSVPRSRLGHVVILDEAAVALLLEELRVDAGERERRTGRDEEPASGDAVLRALGVRRAS